MKRKRVRRDSPYWLASTQQASLHRCLDRIAAGVSVFATHQDVPRRHMRLVDTMFWTPYTTRGESGGFIAHQGLTLP